VACGQVRDGWRRATVGRPDVVVLDATTMEEVANIRLEGKLPAVSHTRFVATLPGRQSRA
jgi:hypothetical protein